MLEVFEELILNLGNYLGLPLRIDETGRCLLNINGKFDVFIEWIEEPNLVRLAVELIELPESPFMERVFLAALRANHREFPRFGNLAYSDIKKSLILFEQFPLNHYQPDEFSDFLEKFVDHAMDWLQSIESGRPCPVQYLDDTNKGFFGM